MRLVFVVKDLSASLGLSWCCVADRMGRVTGRNSTVRRRVRVAKVSCLQINCRILTQSPAKHLLETKTVLKYLLSAFLLSVPTIFLNWKDIYEGFIWSDPDPEQVFDKLYSFYTFKLDSF